MAIYHCITGKYKNMKKEGLQTFACQPIPIFFFLMVAGASVSGCGIGIESAGGKNKITSFKIISNSLHSFRIKMTVIFIFFRFSACWWSQCKIWIRTLPTIQHSRHFTQILLRAWTKVRFAVYWTKKSSKESPIELSTSK